MNLEELKSHVWRGKTSYSANPVIPTGFPTLDSFLPGGGWPHRSVTEIFLDHYGIGELSLLIPALTSLTQQDAAAQKKWIVWVAPPFVPYAPALKQHGMKIDRLLFIDPSANGLSEPSSSRTWNRLKAGWRKKSTRRMRGSRNWNWLWRRR